MTWPLVDEHGGRWWTTDQACAQLRVDRKRINDWVRRSRKAGHTTPAESCQRCAAGGEQEFPHVDPPVRAGRAAAYRSEQLLEAEWWTDGQTRPRTAAA